jgi:uncharacterized protein (TIGR02996 family)
MTAAPPAAAPPLPAPYFRQVLAHPEDDGPRLVAADWWDEQGAAGRAEFVRVQCELARLGPMARKPWGQRKYGKRIRALNRRELKLYRGGWDAEVIPAAWVVIPAAWVTANEIYPAFVYCRGFVEEVICPAADFLAHADAFTAACPLRRVRLTTWPEVEWASSDVALRLVGRGWRSASELFPGDSRGINRAMMLQAYLAAEFPGIDFELPPASSWDTPPRPTSAEDMRQAWQLFPGPGAVAAPREGTSG